MRATTFLVLAAARVVQVAESAPLRGNAANSLFSGQRRSTGMGAAGSGELFTSVYSVRNPDFGHSRLHTQRCTSTPRGRWRWRRPVGAVPPSSRRRRSLPGHRRRPRVFAAIAGAPPRTPGGNLNSCTPWTTLNTIPRAVRHTQSLCIKSLGFLDFVRFCKTFWNA